MIVKSDVSQNAQCAKSAIRRTLTALRNGKSSRWIAESSADVCQKLASLPEFSVAESVALFVSKAKEVQTRSLLEGLLEEGSREVCVPAYDEERTCYRFCRVSRETTWIEGPYGVSQPDTPEWAQTASLDVITVPCVGFDRQGRRLGHGGGYYDRLLAGYGGCRLGLAFSFQEVESIPETEHDQRLKLIVTERGVHRC